MARLRLLEGHSSSLRVHCLVRHLEGLTVSGQEHCRVDVHCCRTAALHMLVEAMTDRTSQFFSEHTSTNRRAGGELPTHTETPWQRPSCPQSGSFEGSRASEPYIHVSSSSDTFPDQLESTREPSHSIGGIGIVSDSPVSDTMLELFSAVWQWGI